jgi:hypothetical protein
MKYFFSIEGGFAGNMGVVIPGNPMKAEGTVNDLPHDLQEILNKIIKTPTRFSTNYNYANSPDEAINKLHIELGDKISDFQFPDTNIPDEVLPLITFLRKQYYGIK